MRGGVGGEREASNWSHRGKLLISKMLFKYMTMSKTDLEWVTTATTKY